MIIIETKTIEESNSSEYIKIELPCQRTFIEIGNNKNKTFVRYKTKTSIIWKWKLSRGEYLLVNEKTFDELEEMYLKTTRESKIRRVWK